MEENRPRGVPLSPKSMVDSVADWPLHRVVEQLKQREKDDKSDVDMNCRLFSWSGIAMFSAITDELARGYGVSCGRMCRWLSYHGDAIAKEDSLLHRLQEVSDSIRQKALEQNSTALSRIMKGGAPYSPAGIDDQRVSFFIYNSWVLSDFTNWADLCGVAPVQLAQVYMLRSVLTGENKSLSGVADRIQQESALWDKWMRYRANYLEMAVAVWESTG